MRWHKSTICKRSFFSDHAHGDYYRTGDIDYEEPYNNVELTGLVGLYEIAFEQAWKMMKERLGAYGHSECATGSARTIIKTAFQTHMIQDETLWLGALIARKNVSHAYHASVALDIIRRTKGEFYDMFVALKAEINTNRA